MSHGLQCWKCGADLSALSLPLTRRDECPKCRAELHVCRMCREFDAQKPQQCREPTVEEVRDKQHANFCDYFAPKPGAYTVPAESQAERARTELEKLFGK